MTGTNNEEIDNAALSPNINEDNINNSIQIHDLTFVPSSSSSSSSSSSLSPNNIVNNNSRTTSKVDEYFTRNNEIQKCRICAVTYSGIGKTSTGTLMNHIKNKHPIEHQRCVQTTLNFQRINPYTRKENFMKTKVMIEHCCA